MVDGIYCLGPDHPESSYFQSAAIEGDPNILTEEEATEFIASQNDSGWRPEFVKNFDLYSSGVDPFDFLDWQEQADVFMEKAKEGIEARRWMGREIRATADSFWLLPFKMLAGVIVGVGSTAKGMAQGAKAGHAIGRMSGSKKTTQAVTDFGVIGGAAVGTMKGLYYGARVAFDTSSFLFESDPYGCFR